jgi:integrase
MSLEAALGELNTRLRAGRHRCTAEQRKASLVLRATLPDRIDPSISRQQRISLNIPATYASLPEVERLAVELGHQLRTGSFQWEAWDRPQGSATITTAEFHAAAVKLHAAKYKHSPERGAAAWAKKWAPALRKLPQGPITDAILLRTVQRLPEGSAGRRDQGNILAQVARALHLDHAALLEACRGYGAASLTPRDIPSDSEIEAAWALLSPSHWRWTWGMCAAYGLRPHECAELVWLEDDWIEIADATKTGSRRVTPCPSAWVHVWGLQELPRPTQSPQTLGKAFADALARARINITPYALRHAYALRLLSRGVSADLAARLMGHSLAVHQQTYQRWIEADRIQKVMQDLRL